MIFIKYYNSKIVKPINRRDDHEGLDIALLSAVIADGHHLFGHFIQIFLGNLLIITTFTAFGVRKG